MNLKLLLLIIILLAGCATKYQNLAPSDGVKLTVKNSRSAAAGNIYIDKHCTRLPSGDWLGVIGKAKVTPLSEYEKSFYIAPYKTMTISMEWYNTAHLNYCVRRATFTPEKGLEYEAEYSREGRHCSLTISNRADRSDEDFVKLLGKYVEYDSVHCKH